MTALMDADNVARRYASRPGCRFVGFQEVGIAVFLMDLRVVVMEAREVPPIDEFLLRALGLSVESPEELASFLGLDARTVHNRLVELRRAELIDVDPAGQGRGVRCRLTDKGKAGIETLYRSALAEITISGIVFHGFLRRPVLVGEDSLLRPRELRERGLPAIPPLPARHPHPEEINLGSLADVVKRQWRQKRKGTPPELISVRSVLSNVKTLYQPTVMLHYELLGHKKQQQVAFAVDGILLDEYQEVFAARKGPERIPEILATRFKSTAELAGELFPPHVVRTLGPLDDVDELVERLEGVTEEIEVKEVDLKREDRPDTRQLLREVLEKERREKERLEQELARRKARRLRTYDCRHLLGVTIRDAKERLVIVSAFLSSAVVDRQFLQQLEATLKRGVKVWVAYGMGSQGDQERGRTKSGDWRQAETGLTELSKRYKDLFQLRDLGNTHEKILLCDNDFVVSGSFNWLSFRGDRAPGKKFRYEDALLVKDPDAIEEYFKEITGRFSGGK